MLARRSIRHGLQLLTPFLREGAGTSRARTHRASWLRYVASAIALLCLIAQADIPKAEAQSSSAPAPSAASPATEHALEHATERAMDSLPMKPPALALVLSGGGAKGLAHIGVLEVLDSAHVPIDLIVGTSIGAAVGGLYAAGYSPAQLEQFALTTNWSDVLDLGDESHRDERVMSQKDADNALLSLRFTGFLHPLIPQALSSGQRLTMLLNSMVINAPGGVEQDFLHELRVPFVAVATDIVSGERRLITHGDLTEAMRASATLPLRFNPLSQDSAILMDGGLIANIPVDVARQAHAQMVIVSNTTAKLRQREDLTTPWEVADQVISLMMQRQNAAQLAHADLVITPVLPQTMADDFRDVSASIEAGREASRAMLPRILQLVRKAPPTLDLQQNDTLLAALRSVRVLWPPKDLRDSVLYDRSLLGLPVARNSTLRDLQTSVVRAYRAHGYSLARIDSIVLRTPTGRADVFVDPGRIGSVEIVGNDDVHPDLVLRELPFSANDVFRASDAERALTNLTGTGLFDYATLQIREDTNWDGTKHILSDDTTVAARTRGGSVVSGPVVLVTVRVRASNVIRLGAIADNEFGARFSTEYANENLAGSGVELSIKGGLGAFNRDAELTVQAPRLFRSFATFLAQVYTGYQDINQYQLQTINREERIVSNVVDEVRELRDFGVRLRAGGQVERLGAVTAELRHEQQRWYSLRDTTMPSTSLPLTAARLELVIDSRNDAAYPHFGTLLSSYAESGLRFLGGQASYTKLYATFEQAIPLSALHTMIARITAGFGDVTTPRLEEFAMGGMESFYGLNEYELRGKQLLEGSLGYQVAIPHVLFFPTYVSARYDIGAVWPKPEAIKFESLVHGLGTQVGVKTPLGLARFGLGENFRFSTNRRHPMDFNNPRFYFSIGADL